MGKAAPEYVTETWHYWGRKKINFLVERDEVGAALWSHVCVVVEDPPPPPPPSRLALHSHMITWWMAGALGLYADKAYILVVYIMNFFWGGGTSFCSRNVGSMIRSFIFRGWVLVFRPTACYEHGSFDQKREQKRKKKLCSWCRSICHFLLERWHDRKKSVSATELEPSWMKINRGTLSVSWYLSWIQTSTLIVTEFARYSPVNVRKCAEGVRSVWVFSMKIYQVNVKYCNCDRDCCSEHFGCQHFLCME